MFTPCTSCRRHIRAEDTACPFCGEAVSLAAPRPRVTVGRLTRAAIFAGAVLAGGCWTTSSPSSNVEKPAQGATGRVTGKIIIDSQPFPSAEVQLVGRDGKQRTAVTDDAGNFVFADLPPGEYTITTAGENRTLTVSAGADTVANFAAASAVRIQQDHEVPVDMPYGAPPARRRRV